MAQGRLCRSEQFNPNGSPQNARILWADDKQLDELSLAVTRREEASDEESSVFLYSPAVRFWTAGSIFWGRGDSALRGGFLFPVEKEPMAQATLSWPFGPIHLEDARGSARDGHSVSIFAVPLEPPLQGTRT